MVRARAEEIEWGEKNSRYFLNLEKRSQRQNVITTLINDDGNTLTNAKDILNEETMFYKKLYSSCNPLDCDNCDFFQHNDYPHLNLDQQESCEGLITYDECLTVLKSMPNNKSPGTDGFPAEWYKFFYKDIAYYLINSFNFSFYQGKLSTDQRRGIIKLIPKKDKDPNFLKNWRPISLLNTDYKLATKCIASRLKNVLPNIINGDQTGFLKSRFIGENIRLALDTIDYLNFNNLPGLMFMIDFEKAFDKLEWKFVQKCFKFFNFGEDILNWLNTFYNDITSCVMNNGLASQFFNLECGVRQGCPLSPYIFIVCGELLNMSIRKEQKIKGINISDSTIKINSYADDTTLYLKDATSLRTALDILFKFEKVSGLKVNREKSEVLPLGSFRLRPPNIDDTGIKYSQGPCRLLGITFRPISNPNDLFELNFIPKFQKLKTILQIWSTRDLSPFGKITILKSLGLSQLIFLLSVLPNPPPHFIKELDTVVYNFIWSGKPDKVKRKTIIGDYVEGGLRMCHIPSLVKGLKIAWIKRLLDSNNNGKWKIFYKRHLKAFGGNFLWHCNLHPDDSRILSIKNDFIRDVVQAWFSLVHVPDLNESDNFIVWNNSHVKIDNKTVFNESWYKKGVKTVSDFISKNKVLYSYEEFARKYLIENCNFVTYFSLVHAIPAIWKKSLHENLEDDESYQNQVICDVISKDKICKKAHTMFVKKIFIPPATEEKWANITNDYNLDWKKNYGMAFKCTLSTKLRYFQYQFLLMYLPLNMFLYKVHLSDTNKCTFCNSSDETLLHFFWECRVTRKFWFDIQSQLMHNIYFVDKKDTFFGIRNPNFDQFNTLILYAKYYIYKCKYLKIRPNIAQFAQKMKFHCLVEKQIALNKDMLGKWERTWNCFNLL